MMEFYLFLDILGYVELQGKEGLPGGGRGTGRVRGMNEAELGHVSRRPGSGDREIG